MTQTHQNQPSPEQRSGPVAAEPNERQPAVPTRAPVEPPAPAASHPSPEERLAEARREAAANYDRYLRAVADLENYRRRMTREKDELRQHAANRLLQDLLPVLDNLQLAVNAARQETGARSIAEGVALVLDQFRDALARHGLKELNPAGEKFDPHHHESLSHQPDPEVPEEHVAQVVRPGYSLHGRLLRPASVVLSSGPAKEAKP